MSGAALSLVVTNARLSTGDPARPWATALGIRDGALAVVGAAAEILKMADAETRIIDARGQTIALPPGATVGSSLAVRVITDPKVTSGTALHVELRTSEAE